MTIIEAIVPDRLSEPETVSFGYFSPVDGERVDDPPEIAAKIEKVGARVMTWDEAFPALDALGSKRAANIVVHTTRGTLTLGHDGSGWIRR